MNGKRKYVLLLLVLVSVFVIVLGTSYAFFTSSINGKEVTIYSGSLALTYEKKSEVITLNKAIPMTNNDGLNQTPYSFDIKNTGTLTSKYQIRLELDNETNIPLEYVKISVYKNDLEYLKPTKISNLNNSLVIVDDGLIESNNIDNYKIRLWIDISAGNDIIGKVFKAKLAIDGMQNIEEGYKVNTKPIIVLNKSNNSIDMNLVKGDTFTDPGVESIKDDSDVLLKSNVVKTYEYYDGTNLNTVQSINTANTGVYYITYKISDSENLEGQAVRVVTVNETEEVPELTLIGSNPLVLNVGDTYLDPGVNAEEGLTVITLGEVKTNKEGTYQVKYLLIDRKGNMNSVVRTVNVLLPRLLNEAVLADNTLITATPDLTTIYPSIASYTDNNFNGSTNTRTMSATYQEYYYTYASSYTFDTNTGKYTLINPQVCKYSECYNTLKNKYVVSYSGSSGSTALISSNLGTIYKITADTTLDKIYYITSTKTENYDTSKSGLYSLAVTGGHGGGNGTTYYFRGNVENNYVDFAGKVWRIVRINEDGTLRLILDDSIDTTGYKFSTNDNNYTYMYYTNSEIKPVLDAWYINNITGTNANKVATGNYFCEAAKVKFKSSYTSGSATMAVYDSYTPDLTCQTDGNSKGLVNASVGLITYDEVVRAGGYYNKDNSNYYLYKNFYWWTMSPGGFYLNEEAIVWDVFNHGRLAYSLVPATYRLRPVINLKADTLATKDESTGHYVVSD